MRVITGMIESMHSYLMRINNVYIYNDNSFLNVIFSYKGHHIHTDRQKEEKREREREREIERETETETELDRDRA